MVLLMCSAKQAFLCVKNFPFTAYVIFFFMSRRTCFNESVFFSVSKAKLSEYSEKIEALAARLAAPVVCYYCIDSFFPLYHS